MKQSTRLAFAATAAVALSVLLVPPFAGSPSESVEPRGRAAVEFEGFDDDTLDPVEDDWALKVVFFNVGNADSVLVLARNGDAALIDAGRWPSAGNTIADFLENEALNGVGTLNTIDLYYTSHYDADHLGGAEQLITHREISVRKALDTGPNLKRDNAAAATGNVTTYEHYRDSVGDLDGDYAQGLDEPNFVRHRIDYGHVEHIGASDDISIQCVSVRGDTKDEDNDDIQDVAGDAGLNENPGSIALVVRFGDFEFFTAGDQTSDAWQSKPDIEERMIAAEAIGADSDIDVMKINHHGSDTSSGPTLVQALDAEVAVCCADWHGTYRHPKKIVLKQFIENDCYVLITGQATDPNTDDYAESSHTDDDDGYVVSADAVRNASGTVIVTVHESSARYTVRAEEFEKTFSARDGDNARP